MEKQLPYIIIVLIITYFIQQTNYKKKNKWIVREER